MYEMSEFHDQIARYRAAIEAFLQAQFCQELPQKRLFDAMRYSLLAGGKRIRPVLTLEFCRICGGDWQSAVPFACALEMIHTYSLIHDDLPCMDNDDYRRGRLTNHKVFGEALAVLAGDGLLTAAFETAANAPADPAVIVRAIRILSEQAGELGMVGGQVLDMQAEEQELTEQGIYDIQRRKTGALIQPLFFIFSDECNFHICLSFECFLVLCTSHGKDDVLSCGEDCVLRVSMCAYF